MSGWKDWAIGEVVTESDFQSFVQDQVVQRYADATERDSTLGANVAEGMICWLDSDDLFLAYDGTEWVEISGGGGTTVSDTPPADPEVGDTWWDSDNGKFFVYYDSFWVEIQLAQAGPQGESGVLAVDAPITYDAGTSTVGIDDATPTSAGIVKGSTVTSGNNVALGEFALRNNSTGSDNVAVGRGALETNTDGSSNTSVGRAALLLNDSGTNNVAFGHRALLNNLASSNTAIGKDALFVNTTGGNNVAVGRSALLANTTGSSNVAVGLSALENNTTATDNTAVGYLAMDSTTTGSFNTAVGLRALSANTIGTQNTAMGQRALQDNTEGEFNTAFGKSALQKLTTGSLNTAIGRSAGFDITTGSNNSLIGNSADPSSVTVSNEITLGNSSISTLRCNQTSISSLSDARDKTNVQDSSLGLDLINRLRPVTFDWDRRDGSMQGYKDVGFIAQEVIEVEDNLDIHATLRMSSRENEEKYEVAPARLIPVLTKAVQELSAQNAELIARIEKLEGN